MKVKLFLPVLASFTMIASLAYAHSVSGREEAVALAFQQKQVLDAKVRAALASPEKEMRAICGKDTQNAQEWAYRFAEAGFAALADSIAADAAANPFVKELAHAYYGRSKIYFAGRIRPMRGRELNGRLSGNDKRIEGIMRAARGELGRLPGGSNINREAEKKIAALIARGNSASACR